MIATNRETCAPPIPPLEKESNVHAQRPNDLTKVPAVTLGFRIVKILCTTLGETGGDSASMTRLGETTSEAGKGGVNGYAVGTAIFGTLLPGLIWSQIRARRFNPWLYWATIVASTTAGATLADFRSRSLGIGYLGGSVLLFACVLLSLFAWPWLGGGDRALGRPLAAD